MFDPNSKAIVRLGAKGQDGKLVADHLSWKMRGSYADYETPD